jgi:hypothetical protein
MVHIPLCLLMGAGLALYFLLSSPASAGIVNILAYFYQLAACVHAAGRHGHDGE